MCRARPDTGLAHQGREGRPGWLKPAEQRAGIRDEVGREYRSQLHWAGPWRAIKVLEPWPIWN